MKRMSQSRLDFESDHEGPFTRCRDCTGRELDEYASPQVQRDYLLWLRAQAAASYAVGDLRQEIDRLRALIPTVPAGEVTKNAYP